MTIPGLLLLAQIVPPPSHCLWTCILSAHCVGLHLREAACVHVCPILAYNELRKSSGLL